MVVQAKKNFKTPDGGLQPTLVRQAVFSCVARLSGEKNIQKAWQALFRSDDTVGIKVNCIAGRGLSSTPEVVQGVVEGLRLAGVKDGNIIIWDRTDRELQRAGFSVSKRGGVLCFGTDALQTAYEPEPEIIGSVGSCFSRIVSRLCTAIVNVPVLKDHDFAGVSIGLKNFYGAIHNPNKYHENHCDPYVADLNTHPYIRGKLRLTVCDALDAQFQGGPALAPRWRWPAGTLLVSRDPVALDAVGTSLIEAQRREHGLPSLKEDKREPKYIATAESRGLGVGRLEAIDRQEV
jgi:uncharacterized protein (DUF362 family)